jgi:hypothetical protein
MAGDRAHAVTLERIDRAGFDDAVLRPLHAWSTRLLAESYDHFARHAVTNDELHVFRRGGELCGFQFWRAFDSGGVRYVLGGKLRVDPAARRRGLHHASALAILRAQHGGDPDRAVVRLSIASLFGFVSLARAMPHYRFVDAAAEPALCAVFARVSAESGYAFDATTGLVDVGIAIPDDQLAQLAASYLALPEAVAYVARNPVFARNRCFVAVVFDVDAVNLAGLAARG